jgi:hypothetical protein
VVPNEFLDEESCEVSPTPILPRMAEINNFLGLFVFFRLSCTFVMVHLGQARDF